MQSDRHKSVAFGFDSYVDTAWTFTRASHEGVNRQPIQYNQILVLLLMAKILHQLIGLSEQK